MKKKSDALFVKAIKLIVLDFLVTLGLFCISLIRRLRQATKILIPFSFK